MDIGVNEIQPPILIKAGATKIIIGSAIFNTDDIIGTIRNLEIIICD